MNGRRVSSIVYWYPPGALPSRLIRSSRFSRRRTSNSSPKRGSTASSDERTSSISCSSVSNGRSGARPSGSTSRFVRSESVDAQVTPALGVQPVNRRHHGLRDCVVQTRAIIRGVVESLQLLKPERGVAVEPGVTPDLLAQSDELVEDLLELGPGVAAGIQRGQVGLAPRVAVLILEVRRHLLQRVRLAAEVDGERSHQRLLPGLELGLLRFQRGVLRAEDVPRRAPPTDQHGVA